MIPTIGIDPGVNAGASILGPDGTGLAWASWRPRRGGFLFVTHDGEDPADNMADVGYLLGRLALRAGAASAVVAIEGQVIRKHIKVAPKSILALAFGAGELLGGLRSVLPVSYLHRPMCEDWTELCGGMGPRQTEQAAAAMRRMVTWQCAPPTFEVCGGEGLGAVSEGAMMALWAMKKEGA